MATKATERGNEIDHFTVRNRLPNGFQGGSAEFRIQIEFGYRAWIRTMNNAPKGADEFSQGTHNEHFMILQRFVALNVAQFLPSYPKKKSRPKG
jgi:hypothetical protein